MERPAPPESAYVWIIHLSVNGADIRKEGASRVRPMNGPASRAAHLFRKKIIPTLLHPQVPTLHAPGEADATTR